MVSSATLESLVRKRRKSVHAGKPRVPRFSGRGTQTFPDQPGGGGRASPAACWPLSPVLCVTHVCGILCHELRCQEDTSCCLPPPKLSPAPSLECTNRGESEIILLTPKFKNHHTEARKACYCLRLGGTHVITPNSGTVPLGPQFARMLCFQGCQGPRTCYLTGI